MKNANAVNWSDPRIQKLLERSEGWQIDNRGTHTPTQVKIHLGMGASGFKPVQLMYMRDKVAIIVADFSIPPGEHVRIDTAVGDTLRSCYGTVRHARPGQRADDQGEHVHWVHIR